MANFRILISIVILSVILYAFTNHGQSPRLIGFVASECNKDLDPYLLIDRIIQKELKGDSMFLTLGLKENCDQDFHPAVYFDKNRLDIILDNTPATSDVVIMAACDCCFELTLIITGIEDTTFSVAIDGIEIPTSKHPYKTYPEQYEIYNGDTINRKNQYGLMEGVWIKFDEGSGKIKTKLYYPGQNKMQRPTWTETYSDGIIESKVHSDTTWKFDKTGALLSKRIMHKTKDQYSIIWFEEYTYYTNGKIRSHCIPSDFDPASLNDNNLDSCQYWNEKGKAIKNSP